MSLSKIPFVIERTEEKQNGLFVFEVHPTEPGKSFTLKEIDLLFAFFIKEGFQPEKAFLKTGKEDPKFIKGFKLYNLKSLLDFSYGEFHEN